AVCPAALPFGIGRTAAATFAASLRRRLAHRAAGAPATAERRRGQDGLEARPRRAGGMHSPPDGIDMSKSPDHHSPNSHLAPLADLLSELTDGDYSAEAVNEIRQLVAEDPAALEWYCDWMNVHSQLYLDMAVGEIGAATPMAPAADDFAATIPL